LSLPLFRWFRIWGESYHLSDSFVFRLFLPQQHQLSLTSFDAQPFDTLNAPQFPSASDSVSFYLIGYGIICLINLAVLIFGILVAFGGSFKASRVLFTDSLTRVVHAPFRHFDATPVGRILSRYSYVPTLYSISGLDLWNLTILPLEQTRYRHHRWIAHGSNPNLSHTCPLVHRSDVRYRRRLALLHSACVPHHLSLCLLLPDGEFSSSPVTGRCSRSLLLQYVKTSRDLRRLESVARSPIFSKFGETLHGIVTCRAFGSERRFLGELFESVDKMLACAYANALTNRYLLFRFDSTSLSRFAFAESRLIRIRDRSWSPRCHHHDLSRSHRRCFSWIGSSRYHFGASSRVSSLPSLSQRSSLLSIFSSVQSIGLLACKVPFFLSSFETLADLRSCPTLISVDS